MSKRRANVPRNPGQPASSPEDQHYLRAYERKLQLIRDRTRGVAAGYHFGCYVHGSGGVGKTYAVVDELNGMQARSHLTNSRISGRALANLLEEYPDDVHVLDDVEPVF